MVLRARETDPPDRAKNARETVRGPRTRVGGDAELCFGGARATRVYENALCRTLFILLENDPETPYRPKDYTSESYFKN